MIFLLSFFWYIRTARALLFALYLWQLKEYHAGRLFAYFKTTKGRRIFFHPFVAAKIALFSLWFFEAEIAGFLLLILYVGETVLFFNAARLKILPLLVVTKKTAVLMFSLLGLQSIVLAAALLYFLDSLFLTLLLFDIFSLFFASLVVLLWQPYTIFERKRMLKRARDKRKKQKNLKVIGITGSYGKTSTKELLAHILQKKFVVLKTPEHKNSEMGIAHTMVYSLTDEHEIFVCEMGAYSKGGIKLLADMIKPTHGIVAGVNEQHLGVFGSSMNLFSAEGGGELVQSLPQEGALILNDDSIQLHELGPWLQLWNPNFANYVWCSAKTQKDFFAKDVVVAKDQVSFIMVGKSGKEAKVVLPLVGIHNVENVLMAAAAAEILGMNIEEIAEALGDVPTNIGGMRLNKGKQGIEILDSSYSANPTGVFAALEHLKLWEGKKIVVMPSLIELGPASFELHVKMGRKIGEICDMAIITTQDEFPALLKGAQEKGMKEKDIFFLENSKEIVEKILAVTKKGRPDGEPRPEGAGDIVLLEGRVPALVLSLLKV